MARIAIFDPTASPTEVAPSPEPAVESLAGKVVGIRLDRIWKSFGWVVDGWERRPTESGVRVRRWVAGDRVGAEGEDFLVMVCGGLANLQALALHSFGPTRAVTRGF